MLSITEHELEGLASPNTSLFLTFVGISLGSLIAVTSTLCSVTISDPFSHATFVGMDWISLFATVLFGILAGKSISATRSKLKELKGSQ